MHKCFSHVLLLQCFCFRTEAYEHVLLLFSNCLNKATSQCSSLYLKKSDNLCKFKDTYIATSCCETASFWGSLMLWGSLVLWGSLNKATSLCILAYSRLRDTYWGKFKEMIRRIRRLGSLIMWGSLLLRGSLTLRGSLMLKGSFYKATSRFSASLLSAVSFWVPQMLSFSKKCQNLNIFKLVFQGAERSIYPTYFS